ncbi:HNH endonuclease [Streptomyces tuirus]|uniref:HNH endonuclease n=1 Tax=Streptomyces tuirus TaxID=68278 RepID=A0A941IZ65_9ACTN|nr:HNH endonuclease [Streptomyces tuirus]
MANLREQADVKNDTSDVKKCSKCDAEKPVQEYYLSKGRAQQPCKPCRRAISLEYYRRNASDPDFRARRSAQGARADKKWRQKNSEYVSARLAAYREGNKTAIAEQYRKWRLANAGAVTEKNQRRRARLIDAFVAPVDRDEIWVRDDGTCKICDKQIDRSLKWPHPQSVTIDHVIPLALGGTHEPDNVQLAHAVCNSRKGDR